MNRAVVLLLIALALAPAAQAQEEYAFDESYFVRVAVGDVPRTNATETDGRLNVVEYLRLDHDGNRTSVTYDPEAAGDDVGVGCDCGSASRTGTTITVGSDVPAGPVVVSLTHGHPFRDAATVPLALEPAGDVAVTFYLTRDLGVSSSAEPATELEGAQFDGTIVQYDEVAAWFTVHPAGAPAFAETKTREVPVAPGFGIDPVSVLLGLLAGALVWYLLVKQGMVQKRRRQEVAVAAHKDVASREPKPVLEGRKRLLMTALKDLEMARMNKEISDEAYDRLKADFKKQAVTTMRALEESA